MEIVRIITVLECVLPSVFIERTILYRTYAVLPVVACRKVCTLYDTSAWEAEETWLKVIQSLREILAEAVLMTHPSVYREEGYVLHVYCDRVVEEYSESSLRIGHGRSHDYLVLLPFL